MNDQKKDPQLVDQIVKDIKKADGTWEVAKETPPVLKKTLKLAQSPPIRPKLYYDVKVESMIPATLVFRVLAEDPQTAADMAKGMSPSSVNYRLAGRRDKKLSVYEAGSSMLKWMKNLLG